MRYRNNNSKRFVDFIDHDYDALVEYIAKDNIFNYAQTFTLSKDDPLGVGAVIGTGLFYQEENGWYKVIILRKRSYEPFVYYYDYKVDYHNNTITIRRCPVSLAKVGATRTSEYEERIINRC